MCSARRARAFPLAGSPIRRSAGQRLFAPHRSLSQLATSFFGFLCQGIHRVPLISSSSSNLLGYMSKSHLFLIFGYRSYIHDRDMDANHFFPADIPNK